ncbi:MAG: hypothetical protein JSS94_04490, partial [Bacteroidetes bacterium]|nr:hypothetical protein [Bacteroidota bacterium]
MKKTITNANFKPWLWTLCLSLVAGLLSVVSAQTVTVGTGATASTAGTNGDPIYRSSSASTFHYSKSQMLYTATDLAAASLPGAAIINSFALNKKDGATVSGTNQFHLKIYLKNSTATALASGTAWSTMLTGATLFYDGTIDATNNFPATAGWWTLTGNTGNTFMYTGGSLEVFVDWSAQGTMTSPFTSAGFTWGYDTATTNQAMGTSNSAVIPDTQTVYTVQVRKYAAQINYTPGPTCTGTPSAGTVNPSLAGCGGQPLLLDTTGATQGQAGVTYQWESSPAGANTWTAVAGAITADATITAPTVATDYHLVVTCTPSGLTSTSGVISFTPNPANMCYCVPTTTGGTTYGIVNFSTSGAAVNINNTSGGSAGYQDFTSTVAPIQVGQSTSFSYSIGTLNTSTYGYAMWIDYNQNGTFETTEQVLTTSAYTAGPKTGTVTIPATATLGTTRLRVMDAFTPNNPSNPCVGTGSGEFEDYLITILPPPSCLPPTNLVISNITVNSADLAWTAATTTASEGYDYYISTSNTAPTATTTPSGSVAAGVLTAGLSGLASNTNYFVWVRSKCNTSDLSAWSQIATFKTLCAIFTVPYTENFDTTATGSSTNINAPSCWKYLKDSSYLGYGYVTTTTPVSTPNVYYLYNGSSTSGNGMLVSPPTVSLSDGNKRIRFMAKAGGANYTLEVGTVSDNTNASSYTAIGSPIALTTNWVLYTVDIPAGTNQYVAIKHGNAASGQSIYLDDILVENIPSCQEPTNVTANNFTTTSADVSWVAPSTLVTVGYEY